MTLGQGHFWPQGHNLNKLGRGPLGDATYHISSLTLMVSEKKIFQCFPYLLSLCKQLDTRAGHFWPQGHHLDKLGRGSLGDATLNIKALDLMV